MELWRPLAQEFLEALLRCEGLGNSLYNMGCSCCGAPSSPDLRLFRCDQCGSFLQCKDCVCARHTLSPLHCIKVSEYWS
jgi:hypothetical protein